MDSDAAPIEVVAPAQPNAHTQKYDRQLRLWASSGQSALENASTLVVNGSATAASTLKNLVLPGIGKYTILDPAPVEGSDVGNNFFLEYSSMGKSRAEEVNKYLLELNDGVKGSAIVQDLADVLAKDPASLAAYSLIIAVDVNPNSILQLADIAWDNEIPFIKARSCGFYGLLRVQVKELTLVETHPESLIDLRVHAPFPALLAFAESFDYEKMDSMEHGHIPAVIILVKALEAWKSTHDGKGPITSAERSTFAKTITAGKRTSDEENFDEAVTLFRRAGTRTGIPEDIVKLFDDPSCETLSATSSNFWLLLRAVRNFTLLPTSNSHLPLSGVLPDMKASSAQYVTLQTLYRARAKEDLAEVKRALSVLLAGLGVDEARIGEEEIGTFVKHAGYLKIIRGRSLREEEEKSALKGQVESITASAAYAEIPDDSLSVYIGFQASEFFYRQHSRFPGSLSSDESVLADYIELTRIAKEILLSLEGGEITEELENALKEFCRSGGTDLPQIAGLMGGLIAQEAIKLVTKQYVPLNGTCIFNGIRSTTSVHNA